MRIPTARPKSGALFRNTRTLILVLLVSSSLVGVVESFMPMPTTVRRRNSACLRLSLPDTSLFENINRKEIMATLQLDDLLSDPKIQNAAAQLWTQLDSAAHTYQEQSIELRVALVALPVLLYLSPFVLGKNTQPPTDEPTYPEAQAATYQLSDVSLPLEFGDAARVRPLLKQTQLEYRRLRTVYDANRHGYNAQIFHQKVDGQGAAVVLAKAGWWPVVWWLQSPWLGFVGWESAVASGLFVLQESIWLAKIASTWWWRHGVWQ